MLTNKQRNNTTRLNLLIFKTFCFAETQYFLGKPAASCTETCRSFGSTCLSKRHGFTNSSKTLSVFRSVNVNCKSGLPDTDKYEYKDSPAYYTSRNLKPTERCVGYKDVPETINCNRGHNVDIQRLCPCQGRYYFKNYLLNESEVFTRVSKYK